ncbi:glycoside hydrolase family 2 protein [candidate division KSB1 bacterium]|nr:glycoside hydrolase family 2 protein [candidate division KSB1 bacterium]
MLYCIIHFQTLIASTTHAQFTPGEYSRPNSLPDERQILLLNNDWEYLEEDLPLSVVLKKSSLSWKRLNLPHTWNAFDATDNDPGYRRDTSWYRKNILIPDMKEEKVIRLYFEGVNISCDVYVNGKRAGGHIGGYVGLSVDMTPYVKKGADNQVLVRVDNSILPEIIPSQKSDFVIYGGITRDVWLQILPPVFIETMQIITPTVTAERATVVVSAEIENTTSAKTSYSIETILKDPQQQIAVQLSEDYSIDPGINHVQVQIPVIVDHQLWSPEKPSLYTLEIIITGKQTTDRITERFGFRWFEFKDQGPFYLNGKRLLLRGTHRHEEWAGYGNAMPDSLHRKDMRMIKEMGANFVRLAHYPQDPEVYRACDELGLLMWDELPWCRGGMGNHAWKANVERLLEEQINQNFNHPSIIMWSVGNEIDWLPDFPDGDNPDSLKTFVSALNDVAHRLDPHRLTAIRKFYDGAGITDVFSPSIWAGWYSGVYTAYEDALLDARKQYPHFFHAEYGGSSHVGRHTENPITGEGFIKADEWAERQNMINIKKISSDGDWSENYIVDLFDRHLMVSEKLDWFAGNAQWAFKDFATPLRPENAIPYMNQKGLVDREGRPKDAFYVFKSYWTTDPKFCYIESHTWPERNGRAGESRQVCVYSNCELVELIINGVSQGKNSRDINNFPACGLRWDVMFDEGPNKLVAVGFSGGMKSAVDSLIVVYNHNQSGKPESIELTSELKPDKNYFIKARVIDDRGRTCLDFNERVYFDCNGSGHLKRYYGTPTGSDIIEFASGRAAIEYIPDSIPGQAIIEARTQDFKGSYLIIENLK